MSALEGDEARVGVTIKPDDRVKREHEAWRALSLPTGSSTAMPCKTVVGANQIRSASYSVFGGST